MLWQNLQDADRDVRGEAIVGLAERGDPRAVDYLIGQLGDDCLVYELMAAEKLASRGLLADLQALLPAAGDTDVKLAAGNAATGARPGRSLRRQHRALARAARLIV